MGGQLLEAAAASRERRWSVRFSRNCSQSTSWTFFSWARWVMSTSRSSRSVSPMRSSTGLLGVERARARPIGVVARPRVDLVVGQDRVGVELLPNLVDELEARKLQKPNRLLQLRRHHQLLAQLDLLLDFHS